jgi:hypothetical protein
LNEIDIARNQNYRRRGFVRSLEPIELEQNLAIDSAILAVGHMNGLDICVAKARKNRLRKGRCVAVACETDFLNVMVAGASKESSNFVYDAE